MPFAGGSFRDRAGRVLEIEGRVLRALSGDGFAQWQTVSRTRFCQLWMNDGRMVRTEQLASADSGLLPIDSVALLEHERLPLISWPYEWSFSMLRDAALLTLDLMSDALSEDCILKDGTPYNVQFRGARAVFMDVGSLEPLRAGRTWAGYRQFCQTMLYPLCLQAWKDVPFQPWMRGSLEGITPKDFASLLSWRDMFRRGALTHGWLHARLQGTAAIRPESARPVSRSLQDSGFSRDMIRQNVRGLHRMVESLQWKLAMSTWSSYDDRSVPVARDAEAKEQFVAQVCQSRRRTTVWDLGCNQGRYSRIAADHAALVVAMDADALTIDRLYQQLRSEAVSGIVPLVMNLADASPSQGWRGVERASLEHRAPPQLVLCLALIHHLVIGSNLLLDDVIDWLASLQAEVVLEFVAPDDEQVRQLLADRENVFDDYTWDRFRRAIGRRFRIVREMPLSSGTRTLFHLVPSGVQSDGPAGESFAPSDADPSREAG